MQKLTKKQKIISLLLAGTVIASVGSYVIYADPGKPECGKEEHEHTDACYGESYVCPWDSMGDSDPITPGGAYVLVCTQNAHTHSDACYQSDLTCTVSEHIHTDECRTVTQGIVCGLAEHAHTEGCYTPQTTQICFEEHEHTEACYMTNMVLSCGQTEHSHTDTCNGDVVAITCTIAEHTHGDGCYNKTLICTEPEHVHTKSCCTHTHDNSCKVTICGKEQHKHTDACYPDAPAAEVREIEPKADLANLIDLNADLETKEEWEATVPKNLYGTWGEKIVQVAKSQLGVKESQLNRSQVADYIGGYSRYGAWYGSHYGHWCAMFASFCIRYAGIEDFPIEANCDNWVELLRQRGCYETLGTGYVPQPGDLIFFERDRVPGHVGIVTSYRVAPLKELMVESSGRAETLVEILNANPQSTFVKKEIKDEDMAIEILTIEGNVREKGSKTDAVLERRYVLTPDDNCTILGFAKINVAEEYNAAGNLVKQLSPIVREVYAGRYSDDYKVTLYADPRQFTSDKISINFRPAKNGEYYWVEVAERNKGINPRGDIFLVFSGYNGEVRDPNLDYVTVITTGDKLYSYYFSETVKPDIFKLKRGDVK